MIRWLLPLTMVLVGAMIGIGTFTFGYAKGYSYLTDDPTACANCHVMEPQYSGWIKSSHRAVATCNDCHTPHTNVVDKYVVKAKNGFWHSFYFTTQTFHEPIQITAASRAITEARCRDCHQPVVEAMGTPAHAGSRGVSCIRCHGSVGHRELSATSVSSDAR